MENLKIRIIKDDKIKILNILNKISIHFKFENDLNYFLITFYRSIQSIFKRCIPILKMR